MNSSHVSRIRQLCREIDEIEKQMTRLETLQMHNTNQVMEYQNALNEKNNELLSLISDK